MWRRPVSKTSGVLPSPADPGLDPEDCWGDDLAHELERLRSAVAERDDRSLWALVVTAGEIANDWLVNCDQLASARAALSEAEREESSTRERLSSLLGLISGSLAHTSAASEGAGGRTDAATGPHDLTLGADATTTSDSAHRGQGAVALGAEIDPGVRPSVGPSDQFAESRTPPGEGLAIYLFGCVRIALGGNPIDVCVHGKALRLFRYLLAHREHAVPKDVLIELLWPDADPDSGRRALHQAVYTIRKSLRDADPGGDLIVFEDDAYRINPGLPTWCDVEEFEQLIDLAHRAETRGDDDVALELLQRSAQLYTAEFAEDAPYEEWALAERERLRYAFVGAVNRLGDLTETAGDLGHAVEFSQRALVLEPCDEESHRRIMRCHAALGNRHLTVRQYQTCVDQLDRDLGLEPSAETVDLFESLIDQPPDIAARCRT